MLDVVGVALKPVLDRHLVACTDLKHQVIAAAPQCHSTWLYASTKLKRVRDRQVAPVARRRIAAFVPTPTPGIKHRAAFGDAVLAVSQVEDVGVTCVVVAGNQRVIARAALERAYSRDGVVARTALQQVGPRGVGDGVVSFAAVDDVGSRVAIHRVASRAAQ